MLSHLIICSCDIEETTGVTWLVNESVRGAEAGESLEDVLLYFYYVFLRKESAWFGVSS